MPHRHARERSKAQQPAFTPPLPDEYGVPSHFIPTRRSEDGKTYRRQVGDHRYEVFPVDGPTVCLAVAQKCNKRPDDEGGPNFNGWVVSGESSDLYTGPIGAKPDALQELNERAAREMALFECFPEVYPYVPEGAIPECDRIPAPHHLPD
ncbi:hypothetical protein ACFVYG_20175 [Streptomyces sp. NPDC058256]|uniref:hypothetical protein n=1 Tax=Streptomyces sp. NPDC058256 TaxID=3346408 RepID=UPI0036E5B65D